MPDAQRPQPPVTVETGSPDTRRFAWHGISFSVPVHWDLSSHHTFKGVTRISMQDDASVRLELEWTRPRNAVDADLVRKRFAKSSAKLAAATDKSFAVRGLPEGWAAVRYQMSGGRELLLAYYLAPRHEVFCFFKFHFLPDSLPRPLKVLKGLTTSFETQHGGACPWRFYDVAFSLDPRFVLASSALRAGNKLLVFEWRLRRLFLWHVSLADMILRKTTLQNWVVDYLNGFKPLPAVRFIPRTDGEIEAQRRWHYPFGQFEEIGRQCFRYDIGYRLIPAKNQIVLWVYHYRRPADLKPLRESFKSLD